MYTSVDLSALHEKKRFTEKTESHIFRPQGWLLLLAGCYLIGIFLGCRVLRLAPDELLHGMKAVFSEHLAIRTAQTLRQLVISSFWQAMIPLLMLFLLGFCALALPVFPIMMGFEGMGYGALISAALETAAETGSPGFRATLVFAPFLLCCALLWIGFGTIAVKQSLLCWKVLYGGNTSQLPELGLYCRKFISYAGASLLLAATNGVWVQVISSVLL